MTDEPVQVLVPLAVAVNSTFQTDANGLVMASIRFRWGAGEGETTSVTIPMHGHRCDAAGIKALFAASTRLARVKLQEQVDELTHALLTGADVDRLRTIAFNRLISDEIARRADQSARAAAAETKPHDEEA